MRREKHTLWGIAGIAYMLLMVYTSFYTPGSFASEGFMNFFMYILLEYARIYGGFCSIVLALVEIFYVISFCEIAVRKKYEWFIVPVVVCSLDVLVSYFYQTGYMLHLLYWGFKVCGLYMLIKIYKERNITSEKSEEDNPAGGI